jgi:hypothetical protein
MAPTYAQGTAPLNVPVSTIVSLYQVLVDAGRVDEFVQATGAKTVGINPITIARVIALLKALSTANELDDFVTLTGDDLISIDPATINSAKDFLFNNNIHSMSPAASTMVNVAGTDCPGNECPHIAH